MAKRPVENCRFDLRGPGDLGHLEMDTVFADMSAEPSFVCDANRVFAPFFVCDIPFDIDDQVGLARCWRIRIDPDNRLVAGDPLTILDQFELPLKPPNLLDPLLPMLGLFGPNDDLGAIIKSRQFDLRRPSDRRQGKEQ